ncbi:MAG: PilW family protein [Deltaproteobacteria bacterium]
MGKNCKGFTLLEVMITIGIFSLVMGYFMVYYTHEIKQYYSKENELELKQDARIALDRVVTKIRSNSGLRLESEADKTVNSIINEDDVVIINTVQNQANGEINFSYDSAKGYGELRDSGRNKIVGNISEFSIKIASDNDQILIIKIACKNGKSDKKKEYTTAVRLH